MGQRELLLTLGAIVAFGTLTLSINQQTIRNTDAMYEQQAQLFGLQLAQSFIEEAKTRAFDAASLEQTVGDSTEFTYPPTKGVSEFYPNFNDVDDYNNLSQTVSDTLFGNWTVNATIEYVEETDLNTPVNHTTFYKRMTVTVAGVYLRNAITTQYIFAYQKHIGVPIAAPPPDD